MWRLSTEERELYATIAALLLKLRMRRVILTLRVLENQQASLAQQLALEDQFDHLFATFKVVRCQKQRHYSANKGPSSQGYGSSCGHVWM